MYCNGVKYDYHVVNTGNLDHKTNNFALID